MIEAQIFELIGLFYFFVGFGILINQKFYGEIIDDILNSRSVLFLSGILITIMGYLLVAFHGYWDIGWGLIITIFGYLSLFKGLFIIFLPEPYLRLGRAFRRRIRSLTWIGIASTLIGILLMYLGYLVL